MVRLSWLQMPKGIVAAAEKNRKQSVLSVYTWPMNGTQAAQMQCDRMPSGVVRVERRSSAVSSYLFGR
jgi:hypothetical protein